MDSFIINTDSIVFLKPIDHNVDVNISFSSKDSIIAYAVQNELIIQNLKTEGEKRRFMCDFSIDLILWSPDSELISCCMFKQNLIQVWSLSDPSWRCKITESAINMAYISWTPDSRHLLVVSEFNFKITIWSLTSSKSTVISNPKCVKNCYAFSKCSKYMAVIERKDFVDSIGVYSCDNFQCLMKFPIDCENASEIYFSPNELVIGIVAAFSEYKVLFYTVDGRLINSFTKADSLLGVTSFSWDAKGLYIFITDYLEKISILSGKNYKEINSLNLPESISSTKTTIYRTIDVSDNEENVFTKTAKKWEFYEVDCERPLSISQFNLNKKSNNKVSKNGANILAVSSDGQYVAIVGSSVPFVVFIFNMRLFLFSDVIMLKEKVKGMVWHPSKTILAFFTGYNHLDLWTPNCCIRMIIPFDEELLIKNIGWCSTGESIVLNGKQCSTVLTLPLFS